MKSHKTAATATPEAPEIPEIKLVGVQKKKDRKKGGFGLFGGNAARGGFSGATGGLGGAAGGSGGSFITNLIAQVGQNLGVFAFVAAVGLAAAGYGRLRAPEYKAFKDAGKEGFAAHKQAQQYSADVSKLPTNRPTGGDSLGMISGSLDGKTQVERDKEAAEAAAKAKADAEAKAKEEADQKAKDDAAAKAQAPDPSALMGAVGGAPTGPAAAPEPKGLGHGKIGGLSTSLGGASALSGGAGMSGGIGGAFAKDKFDPNKLLAMRAAPQVSRTTTPSMPSYRGIGRGKAMRQLDKVAHYSNLARSGANESRSTNASAPFDNATPGGDRITGAGARDGNSPKDSTPESNPSPNSPGQGGGSPIDHGDGLQNCPNGMRAVSCVNTVTSTSVDPTDGIVSMLHMLMMIVTALAIIQLFLDKAKDAPIYGAAWVPAWLTMANIIGALGIAIAGLGVTLMTMGRPIMGGIATAIGAATAVVAFVGSGTVSATTEAIAAAAMNGIGSFLKNPDHKEADPDHPGSLREGGGGWF